MSCWKPRNTQKPKMHNAKEERIENSKAAVLHAEKKGKQKGKTPAQTKLDKKVSEKRNLHRDSVDRIMWLLFILISLTVLNSC